MSNSPKGREEMSEVPTASNVAERTAAMTKEPESVTYITCESCGSRIETTGHDGQDWKSGEKFTCKKCGHVTLFNTQSQRIAGPL